MPRFVAHASLLDAIALSRYDARARKKFNMLLLAVVDISQASTKFFHFLERC
jgi:hypothetical protein